MFVRKLALLAAISALGLLAIGSASASATSVRADPSGTALTAGTSITNGGSDPATLALSGFGEINCTSTTFSATVGASGGASVTGTLDALTFTSCTDTLPVITISSCHLANAGVPTVHITAIAGGGTVVLNNTFVRCILAGSTSACYYQASTASGTAQNANSALSYTGVAVTHSAPAGRTDDLGGVCGNSGSFNATLTDVRAPTGTITITTN
jgi:hypothetical protein